MKKNRPSKSKKRNLAQLIWNWIAFSLKGYFVLFCLFHLATCTSIDCDVPLRGPAVKQTQGSHAKISTTLRGEVTFFFALPGFKVYRLFLDEGYHVWVKVPLNKQVPNKGDRLVVCSEWVQVMNFNGLSMNLFVELERIIALDDEPPVHVEPPDMGTDKEI